MPPLPPLGTTGLSEGELTLLLNFDIIAKSLFYHVPHLCLLLWDNVAVIQVVHSGHLERDLVTRDPLFIWCQETCSDLLFL